MQIINFSFTRKSPLDFYCLLWFKSKYNNPEELMQFIKKYRNLWQTDSFLLRQVTAILSRLLILDSKKVETLLSNQISSGAPSTVTLASQIILFKNLEKLDTKLNFYLFPQKRQSSYPLAKFLVLCSVLNSEKIRNDESVKKKILENIKDPYFLFWLESQYNIK